MRKLFFLVTSFAFLSGCSQSVYESGWNREISNQVFNECAKSSFKKGFYFNQNVDRLVPMGLLTQQEAERAKSHNVSIGDKECLAYAAYGFNPTKYFFKGYLDKRLVSRSIEYRCEKSEINCPGKLITITDGIVVGIDDIK
ncbi:hypothetical protein [Pectobacterium parmentieri]|uniref:hypothetical protein n=1 Tax=Pectobacterium parmentieri TaxID=1905730 RepID=UPI0011B23E73|nr:hypothetical protein [Pectobacterium parmentieri]